MKTFFFSLMCVCLVKMTDNCNMHKMFLHLNAFLLPGNLKQGPHTYQVYTEQHVVQRKLAMLTIPTFLPQC